MLIGAVVVLFNPDAREINNIKSYISVVGQIIILDNSQNDNFNLIKNNLFEYKDLIVYRRFKENIGLAKALNIGIHHLFELGYEWALVMDSDSSFLSNVVEEYRDYLEHEPGIDTVAILAPVHIYDRSKATEFDGNRLVDWAMTSGCLFNIKIFIKNNGFNENLFVDGLDIDYCYKIAEKGYQTIQCGHALLKHFPGSTQSFRLFHKELFRYGSASPDRYYLQSKALVWIILRYHRPKEYIRLLSKWGKIILLFKNKKQYIDMMLKGSKEGVSLWKKYKIN